MLKANKATLLVALIFIGMGLGTYYIMKVGRQNQNEVNEMVEPMIREMVGSNWSRTSLNKYATPNFKKWLDEKGYTENIPEWAALGQIEKYDGLEQFTSSHSTSSAVALVQFNKGEAHIDMKLSKQDKDWLVDAIKIDSVALNKTN